MKFVDNHQRKGERSFVKCNFCFHDSFSTAYLQQAMSVILADIKSHHPKDFYFAINRRLVRNCLCCSQFFMLSFQKHILFISSSLCQYTFSRWHIVAWYFTVTFLSGHVCCWKLKSNYYFCTFKEKFFCFLFLLLVLSS